MSPSGEREAVARAILPAVPALAVIVAMVWATGRWWVCHGPGCDGASMDVRILEWLHQHRREWLDRPMIAVTWLGSLYVLAPLAVLWTLGRGRDLADRILAPLTLLGAAVSVHVMKTALARPRPATHEPLVALPDDFSFPSAHAAQSAAFWLAVCLAAQAPRGLRVPLAAAAIAVVLAVCASRMYLQVHYPSDVAAGLIVGTAWVFAGRRMLPRGSRVASHA